MPYIAGSLLALRSGLHALLVRAVCVIPALQTAILPHLVSFLGVYNWRDPNQAAWLTSIIPDIVDAVQSMQGSTGTEALAAAATHCLC